MRTSTYEAEAERCRKLANEYSGRAEAPFLISVAKAFSDLEAEPGRETLRTPGIRLFG